MRAYILRIVAAAIISAVVSCLVNGKSSSGKMIRLLCGILMAVTVITPLTHISFGNISDYWNDITYDADVYVEQGERTAKEEYNAIIKDRFEAYILDKATRMGLEIAVEVELDDSNDSVPCQITVTGALSPYAKGVLSEYITEQLGIPKECQQWI